MPLPQRVSQPTRDTLVTQFGTNYGSGPAALALADATADLQRMPQARVRAILRKVSDIHTIGAAVTEMDVKRGVTSIADGGTDAVAGTVAGTATPLTYKLDNLGSTLLQVGSVVISAPVNCTVTVAGQGAVTQPAIGQDGIVAPTVQAVAPLSANVPAVGFESVVVTVTPAIAGAWSFGVSVANSDANENPYNWTVSGTAT